MELSEDFEYYIKQSLLNLEDFINREYTCSLFKKGVLETNPVRGVARLYKSKEELRLKKRTASTYKDCYTLKIDFKLKESIDVISNFEIGECISQMSLLLEHFGEFKLNNIIYSDYGDSKKGILIIDIIEKQEWKFLPLVIQSVKKS